MLKSYDEDMGFLILISREGGLGCELPSRIEYLPPLNFGSESEISDYELTEKLPLLGFECHFVIENKMKRGWNRGLLNCLLSSSLFYTGTGFFILSKSFARIDEEK